MVVASTFKGDGQSPNPEIIFSVEGGDVWASWPDRRDRARLGSYDAVKAAMSEFLAQCVIGERLLDRRNAPL
jgi:hypothetical protein